MAGGAGSGKVVAGVDESRRAWLMIGGVITVVLLNLAAVVLMNTLGR